jgi:hypothetical protein
MYDHGDPPVFVALLGVEHGRPAHRAEPEPELCTLVSGAHELRGSTRYRIGCGEPGKGREHAPGALLACQAMADAHGPGFTPDLNLKLAAVTGSRPCRHGNISRISGASQVLHGPVILPLGDASIFACAPGNG